MIQPFDEMPSIFNYDMEDTIRRLKAVCSSASIERRAIATRRAIY